PQKPASRPITWSHSVLAVAGYHARYGRCSEYIDLLRKLVFDDRNPGFEKNIVASLVSLTFSQILSICERVTRRKPLGKQLAKANAFAANPDKCRHAMRTSHGREKCRFRTCSPRSRHGFWRRGQAGISKPSQENRRFGLWNGSAESSKDPQVLRRCSHSR